MRILVMALVLLLPSGVLAQLRPPVARADFTIATGAFGKRHEERPRDDRFTNTAVGELIGGLYWTDHLKTEMSVACAYRKRCSRFRSNGSRTSTSTVRGHARGSGRRRHRRGAGRVPRIAAVVDGGLG
jgi:hypothetical protein